MKVLPNQIEAVARAIHDEGMRHSWFGPYYKIDYEQLRNTDSRGFKEFNDIVARALEKC